jgi:hypothetical protein
VLGPPPFFKLPCHFPHSPAWSPHSWPMSNPML